MLLFRYLFVFVVLKCVYAVSSSEAPIQCSRSACDDSVGQDCCVPMPGLMSLRAAKTVYSYITRATTVTVWESILGAIMCVVIGIQRVDSVKQLINIVTAR